MDHLCPKGREGLANPCGHWGEVPIKVQNHLEGFMHQFQWALSSVRFSSRRRSSPAL